MITFLPINCIMIVEMKILIVFNHPAPYKIRLFNELAKHFDLEVIFEREKASNRPDAFYNIKEFNFKYQILKKGAFGEENSNSNELVKIIKNRHSEFDHIIMNGYSTLTELRAIRYMNKHNIPFVLYINGGLIKKESSLKRKIKIHFISSASHYFSPCEQADEYLSHYGADKNKISHYVYSTIYDSDIINKPLTEEEKIELRKKYNLPEGDLYISASQFIKRKNNTQLIDCFKTIDATLLLVGEGKQKEEYKRIIKDNNQTNVIIFPYEKRSSLFELMKCCDGFITLSSEDIYGHTTNEAFAMGLPVLSSNKVVGSRHLIKDGINGFLVDLSQNNEIIEKIKILKTLNSIDAINTAKENTIEKNVASMVEIIEKLEK